MLSSTISRLRCPQFRCPSHQVEQNALRVHAVESISIQSDIWSGHVECTACRSKYPILAGVLVLVAHVQDYLCAHVKGISKHVDDSAIPEEYRDEYLEAKEAWLEEADEHIEEDLESERVTSLYLMNHYLRVEGSDGTWFKTPKGSPLIEKLIAEHWDHGPFEQIEKWITELRHDIQADREWSLVELGCGVGGLSRVLKGQVQYLGVDSSFASIALARHLNLGVPYPHLIQIPGDLINGAVSRTVDFKPVVNPQCDFILADLEELPLAKDTFDGSIALNAIDMLDDPSRLPKLQFSAVKANGFAIQSCPYIWHARIAKHLRSQAPKTATDSAAVVEWLYEKAGFQIHKRENQIPWLFFKHFRQLEVYSVHALIAKKANSSQK